MVVDDEPGFRTGLAGMLRDDGHHVVEFPSADAVPAFETLPQIDVLITDYEMPGRNGLQLADAFHRARPQVPIILVTAFPADVLADLVARRPYVQVLSKPLDYAALHDAIHHIARPG